MSVWRGRLKSLIEKKASFKRAEKQGTVQSRTGLRKGNPGLRPPPGLRISKWARLRPGISCSWTSYSRPGLYAGSRKGLKKEARSSHPIVYEATFLCSGGDDRSPSIRLRSVQMWLSTPATCERKPSFCHSFAERDRAPPEGCASYVLICRSFRV